MINTFQLTLSPQEAANEAIVLQKALQHAGLKNSDYNDFKVVKRSIDARSKQIKVYLTVVFYINESAPLEEYHLSYKNVQHAKHAVIIGAGPAGLFAGLKLLEKGIKPIILERGKDVRARRRDLAALNKDRILNTESNYCFGEGGAGTYSDGKLYTRSNKRGDIDQILKLFVAHGASPEILIESHPHLGTNKLPGIITQMRETILHFGGEVRFNTKLTDILIHQNSSVKAVVVNDVEVIETESVILATGHSARDIFELFYHKKWHLESKPFALGIRVEHPQSLIDKMQYHCEVRSEYLPPAAYSLVHQVGNRGVYSFCMCPGGIIAPCATGHEEVVTNGWSPSKRNNPFANSGIVVSVMPEDVKSFEKFGPLSGLKFQQMIEKNAWLAGGSNLMAPAQRLEDFTRNIVSTSIPENSYHPGTFSTSIAQVFTKPIANALKEGFIEFGKKKRNYITNQAVILATESRTSSPVRIPRDVESLQHTQIKGLYPCGEGAGYAGGIVSAAIDGIRCAEKIL
jgi:uncharacterized FAD-dependent dehydrogenase